MRALAVLCCLCAGLAQAEGLDRSPRPMANPLYALPDPVTLPQVAAMGDAPVAQPLAEGVVAVSLRPKARPKKIAALVEGVRKEDAAQGLDLAAIAPEVEEPAAKPKKRDRAKEREAKSKKGSVCGVAAIKGEQIATIKSKVKGCGLQDGVRVTSVSGVRLSQAATIDCTTAKALNTWVDQVVQPAYGGRVVELKIAAHYICRSRNNIKGAKVSEHGRGKAVDVSAFVLDNGKVHSVLGGFNKTMRRAYKGACGLFGTTLGPGSDGYHEDHLHLDTAQRGSAYCR